MSTYNTLSYTERKREREKEMWLVQLVNKPEDIIDSYALCVIIIYINNNLDNFNMWIYKYALSFLKKMF